jgi:OmcA/MtrC family decaheme c-type cytochrome
MAGLMAAALAGCGGGGTTGANTTVATVVPQLAASQFLTIQPTIDPASISVSIPASGKPVVTFKVTDAKGNPVIGLGGQIAGTATALPTNYNLQFTLAKLIPADTAGNPSKWVSYVVTAPATFTAAAPAVAASGSTPATPATATSVATWKGAFPSSDTNGTLTEPSPGTYSYTFLRDITAVQAVVTAMPDTQTVTTWQADLTTKAVTTNLAAGTTCVPGSLITSGTPYTAGYTTTTYNCKADLDVANLAYDATATHRLGIIIQGSQPGTGTNTPNKVQVTSAVPLANTFNIGFDFVPNGAAVTATRDIVVKASCAACHDGKGIGHASTNTAAPGVSIGRNDPRLCVTCHTDQTKFGFVEAKTTATGYDDTDAFGYKRVKGQAAFTYPRMIHQTHMGENLVKTGYNLNAHARTFNADGTKIFLADGNTQAYGCTPTSSARGQCFNVIGLPQAVDNCSTCHAGATTATGNKNITKDGDNWMNKPSILACQACHDGLELTADGSKFVGMGATGGITLADKAKDVAAKAAPGTTKSGHAGGSASNAVCSLCHKTGGLSDIAVAHSGTFGNANNPTPPAGVAKIAYDIKSFTLNSTGNPVVKFRITKTVNGTAATVTSLPLDATAFTSGPTLLVAYAVPQDGIQAPADFNVSASSSLANLVDHTKGNLGNTAAATAAAPVTAGSDGYFTATLTGTATAPIQLPSKATLATVAVYGYFTQLPASSGQAANVAITSRAALRALDTTPATPGRRAIVVKEKCETCHAQLDTDPAFHNSGRNDPQLCAFCHTAQGYLQNGWTGDTRTFIHAIHATDKRSVFFSWRGGMLGQGMYPGVLKDCNQCHLPNTVNLSANASSVPNLLWTTTTTGKFVAAGTNNSTTYTAVAGQAGVAGYGGVVGAPNCTSATKSSTTDVTQLAPSVAYGTTTANAFDYGAAFAQNIASTTDSVKCTAGGVPYTIAAGAWRDADETTLVSSPIAAACFACHDTSAAQGHMVSNGGALNEPRSTALKKQEGCLVCHGAGKDYDAAVVHQ